MTVGVYFAVRGYGRVGWLREGALVRTDNSVNKWLDLKELEALNRA